MPSIADSSSSNRLAVVADDDATTRLLIRAALEEDGWTVEEAADGVLACEAVERLHPDVVLLDVDMPALNGFEACARLRSFRGCRHIPVMMITGMDDQESISRAYDAGATDFLPKPPSFEVLRQRLRHMRRAEQDARNLRNERDFVSAVVDHSAALVVILDPLGQIVRFNESCEQVSGFSLSETTGKPVWDILTDPHERDRERARFERLISQRENNRYEGSWTTRDGKRRHIVWSNSVLVDRDGRVENVVCTGLDITDLSEAEERIQFLAAHDLLTGLPNRHLVTERLEQAIAEVDDAGKMAVILLDLDRFNNVNTSLGRSAGDQLLRAVADRLTKSLRLSDVLARQVSGLRTELGCLGGDEFTAVVTGVPDAKEVAAIVERLQHALDRPFTLEGQKLSVTSSVGVAMYPGDGTTSETLLRHAESAMNSARGKVRGSYHFYSSATHARVSERFSLETELRDAIKGGELVLHYQPKTSTVSGHIAGAEALVRWQHPSRGLVAPTSFIEIAEETGLIVPIGDWVLREACRQVTAWLESGLTAVPVAVNLSSAQFRENDILERIASVLNETSLDPKYLALEITESMVMYDVATACEILHRLSELGVRVGIDDFGTGYSALSSLKDLPAHHLKIDRAFIKDLAIGSRDIALTQAIIDLAHGLDLTVVAEGVESDEQLAILREQGCDEVQGFLIGQPLPNDQFAALLDRPRGDVQAVSST